VAEGPVGEGSLEQQIEGIIGEIRGIKGVRVQIGKDNEVEEVHIMASSDRNAKQIVRDIQSSLMVEMDYRLDHKKISIVQAGQEEAWENDRMARLRLVSVGMVSKSRKVDVLVELSYGEEVFLGETTGPNLKSGKLRLIAEATVKAIENYLKSGGSFFVEDVVKHQVAGKPVVTVALAALLPRREEKMFFGTVLAETDEKEAVARATLGAINRILRFLPGEKGF